MTAKKSRNAKTEHSKELRRQSAHKHYASLTKDNILVIRNKDAEKMNEIKRLLSIAEGRTNADKILNALRKAST